MKLFFHTRGMSLSSSLSRLIRSGKAIDQDLVRVLCVHSNSTGQSEFARKSARPRIVLYADQQISENNREYSFFTTS
ncbi:MULTISPECIES: hypothetical protein [Nitrosomonas]|uniref:hypothetical protein n=1 Tax=Nitrosomonas TaxID=914 RepID=UPI001395E865|nr:MULTISPECIES: hypothetical protein [Nitrosomonas]UVS63503.1 hypothetical protein NX761_11025 [Nitrosomonas sp. PLL12]